MKEQDAWAELSSIRSLMERSVKFISLHGLSGVMAGIYALIGACVGYRIVDDPQRELQEQEVVIRLSILALVVLFLSVSTAILLSSRKARKNKQQIWNTASKGLLIHAGIPLITGGFLILIFLYRGYFEIISSTCLIFYGIALVSGSQYTFKDLRWLGLSEIFLGLSAAFMPEYGLLFWSAGFGVLHILYGLVMYHKYDSKR